MYTIKVDGKGYFCGWDVNKEMHFSDTISPIIIKEDNRVYDFAKEINEETGKRVWVYKLTEENHHYFPEKTTFGKDLKKGNIFMFPTNDKDKFMMVSDNEFICLCDESYYRFGKFYDSKYYNADRVKIIPQKETNNG